MQHRSHARQRALFPSESFTWEAVPDDRRQDVVEVLSQLLAQALETSLLFAPDPQDPSSEDCDV